MKEKDKEYLLELVQRYKGYKSPSVAQQLLIYLGEKSDRTDDDKKKLSELLKMERAKERASKAKARVSKLLNEEREKERKAQTRRKVIWGGALLAGAKKDKQIADVMRKLVSSGYVSDKDKQAIFDDLNGLSSSSSEPSLSEQLHRSN